jgi:hypothetical protein
VIALRIGASAVARHLPELAAALASDADLVRGAAIPAGAAIFVIERCACALAVATILAGRTAFFGPRRTADFLPFWAGTLAVDAALAARTRMPAIATMPCAASRIDARADGTFAAALKIGRGTLGDAVT